MSARHYRFEGFELDARSRELRDANGAVSLPLKSFDCLVYLLERRERAVGRDELISAVWGRVDVSDALLGQTLARARRAVGDTGEEQHVIRTVARFGYHWVAPILVIDDDAPHEAATNVSASHDEPVRHAIDSAPAPARRARTHAALAFAITLLLVVAIAVFVRLRSTSTTDATQPAAAGTYLVLPVDVMDASAESRWIRLGAMDYLASRLRERAGLPVLPADQTIAYLGRNANTGTAPLQRLRLAQSAGASVVLASRAHRSDAGWLFEFDIEDAEHTAHYAATAPTPLEAADLALAQFLGIGATNQSPQPVTLIELQQRIDAAFLEGDLHQAAEAIEAAPPQLQREPAIAVRAAEVDERSGRMELAERQFSAIAARRADMPVALHARALYGLCAIAYRRNDLHQADTHCRAALAALAGHSEPMLLGRAHMLLGVIDDQLGRFDDAMGRFGLARIEWRRAGNLPGEASVDADEGLAQSRHGRFAEAVAAFDRAAAIFQRFGVQDHLASSLAAKSDAQRLMLDLDGALASSEQAWQITPRMDDARAVLAIAYTRTLALLASGRLQDAARLIDRYDTGQADAPPEFAVLRRQWLAARGRYREASDQADAVVDRVLAPPDPSSDARLSSASDVLIDAALRADRRDLAEHLVQRLREAGASPLDPDRDFVLALADARVAADTTSADAHFAAALDLALQRTRPDQIVASASAYVLFLLQQARLDDATRVAGRLALYADKDYAAAAAMAALYDRLGDARAAELARTHAARLAGERGAAAGS
jgi:DNA-binding winged helix-turn-helix (wHTH) protein/tetratricopeptide (TPR) repeat protein